MLQFLPHSYKFLAPTWTFLVSFTVDSLTTATHLRENMSRGVYVDGLTEQSISSARDAYQVTSHYSHWVMRIEQLISSDRMRTVCFKTISGSFIKLSVSKQTTVPLKHLHLGHRYFVQFVCIVFLAYCNTCHAFWSILCLLVPSCKCMSWRLW